MQQSIS